MIRRLAVLCALAAFASPATAQCEAKLLASDGAEKDQFGLALAFDGDTLAIGAPSGYLGPGSGWAYVFERAGSRWTEQAKLVASNAASADSFGASIALSGESVVAGAPGQGLKGAAYAFVRSGSAWSEQAILTTNNIWPGARFGASVSLSGDTAVIGAPLHQNQRGAAYVFERTGSTWIESARLLPQSVAGVRFGISVGIDGNRIIVGAMYDAPGGAAHVFVRTGSSWSSDAVLLADDGEPQDSFGAAVAIDGDTIVVGAYEDRVQGVETGSAYVFVRRNDSWLQEAKLLASDAGDEDAFGISVSVHGDRAVIGARHHDHDNVADRGSAYSFVRTGTMWSESRELSVDDYAPRDDFGSSVSLCRDEVAVGIVGDDDLGDSSGSVVVFREEPRIYCTAKANTLGCLPTVGFSGCSSATATSGFIVSADQVRNQKLGMLLYGLAGATALPYQGGHLCLSPPLNRTPARGSGGHLPPINDCSGIYALDLNAFASGNAGGHPRPELRVPGTLVHTQWWGRDNGDPFGTSLSNALEYETGP